MLARAAFRLLLNVFDLRARALAVHVLHLHVDEALLVLHFHAIHVRAAAEARAGLRTWSDLAEAVESERMQLALRSGSDLVDRERRQLEGHELQLGSDLVDRDRRQLEGHVRRRRRARDAARQRRMLTPGCLAAAFARPGVTRLQWFVAASTCAVAVAVTMAVTVVTAL